MPPCIVRPHASSSAFLQPYPYAARCSHQLSLHSLYTLPLVQPTHTFQPTTLAQPTVPPRSSRWFSQQATMHRLSLAVLVLVAGAAAAGASRFDDIQSITDGNGNFDFNRLDQLKTFLTGILPADIIDDQNWLQLCGNLMTGILPDSDFIDNNGNIVPPSYSGAVNQVSRNSNPGCGRISRKWVRMPFHDCGTFDKNKKTGGCNGSLRLEIPTPADPPRAFDQFTQGPSGQFSATDHGENNGFAESVTFFENARQGLSWNGQPISWADTMTLGGILGLWVCGGDPVPFRPGRVDAAVPDAPGQLPGTTDSLNTNIASFDRMGLTKEEFVLLAGGAHSISSFVRGRGDNTPDVMDNLWATEAITWWNRGKKSKPWPQCNMIDMSNFDPTFARTRSVDHCTLKFVSDMNQKPTKAILTAIAKAPSADFIAKFSTAYAKMCELGFDATAVVAPPPQQPNNLQQFQQFDNSGNGQQFFQNGGFFQNNGVQQFVPFGKK